MSSSSLVNRPLLYGNRPKPTSFLPAPAVQGDDRFGVTGTSLVPSLSSMVTVFASEAALLSVASATVAVSVCVAWPALLPASVHAVRVSGAAAATAMAARTRRRARSVNLRDI